MAGLAGGIPAMARLQDLPDGNGWTIGVVVLIIVGAGCLLAWMILGALRLARPRTTA